MNVPPGAGRLPDFVFRAIDPGEVHVGVADFHAWLLRPVEADPDSAAGIATPWPATATVDADGGSALECVHVYETTPNGLAEELAELDHSAFDLLVVEEFRLFPWMAREQGYHDFPTVELIGVIKYLAKLVGIPVAMQGASVKKMAVDVARGRGFPLRVLPKGRTDFVANNQHKRDAISHGVWYAYRNEDSPLYRAVKRSRRSS